MDVNIQTDAEKVETGMQTEKRRDSIEVQTYPVFMEQEIQTKTPTASEI